MPEATRVAAVQIAASIGDVDANMQQCERLADQAAVDGAQWIILPEFFTTGVAFQPDLVNTPLPPDGAATGLLRSLARRHGATVGGSFLCRDYDGHVRNAFFLVTPDGEIAGRHDKDLPTMWENCFYVGGQDKGIIDVGSQSVGVAMCWELIRSQTARRLRGNVDVVVGGSCWWSVPSWSPRNLTRRMEVVNKRNATRAADVFARLVGAPVVHAAHCGPIECRMPWSPLKYKGWTEGGAAVFDATGKALAFRSREEGPGVVVAEVQLGRAPATDAIPDDYWLCRRGAVPSLAWSYQRTHGKRWYAANSPVS
ncbi:MAG TPA: carbon-nitrogen hydrolase family protein [Solirubrobacterales bacterium]|jgi:predicted amidohydrolase|nr:carbon-nitrogen hydrolase family protein [Solirubrobacterales bacterium]